jgi:hypothetical protein
MQDRALLQSGAQGPVHAILQIKVASPADDMREKVPVVSRVLGQDGVQVQHVLGGDELVQPDRARRDLGPFASGPCMVGIGPPFPNLLEDHMLSVDELGGCRRAQRLLPSQSGGNLPARYSRALAVTASRITMLIEFLLQWDDELVPREATLALFDAFASPEKILHANSGRHMNVPLFELDSSDRFFTRHLV